MPLFEHPLDTKLLLRKKRGIKKELLSQDRLWLEKKIAVLGGSTTNELVDQLELFLLYHGIKGTFYQSDYGQYWQDGVFGNPTLDQFAPDIIYVHTSWRNISFFPEIDGSAQDTDLLLQQEYQRFLTLWSSLQKKFTCPIIQNNFDRPDYRLMGNRDIWDFRGRSNFISRLNQLFYEYAQTQENFYINDLDYLCAQYGLSTWGDPLYWHMYKYAMCVDAIPSVAQSVANIIKSIYGRNKKVLALDLDNTLWGGVVGDDGVEGIQIGPEVSKGQVYAAFQSYCKELQKIGVVLVVNSKNELENALAGLNHPDGILRPGDFVSIKANWIPKDQNLRAIADELDLGVDSFVFADDNPAEREIVSAQFPGVAVPILDGPEHYVSALDQNGYFETTVLSTEDMRKTDLYHAKAQAKSAQAAFSDYGEYLDSLQMKAIISDFPSMYIQRIAQLTNKTNQFNLTTLRCTEDDIQAMQDSSTFICLSARLSDKFADHGLVCVAAGEILDKTLHIRLWLMSCRVLKRGLEDAVMNALVEAAKSKNIHQIFGYYYPTAKNSMTCNFYAEMGFELYSQDDNGNTVWSVNPDSYQHKTPHMEIDL